MCNLKLPQTTSGNTNAVCIFSFYCCPPLKVKPHGKFAVEHANQSSLSHKSSNVKSDKLEIGTNLLTAITVWLLLLQ